MIEVRPLHKADLFKIKDCLVEPDQHLSYEMAEFAENSGMSFTYLKDDKPVGCCGAGLYMGVYVLWAVYSRAFSATTRARAAIAFIKALRAMFPGKKALISIPSYLSNGVKYAKFLGGTYIKTIPHELVADATNDIYEVA